MFKATKKKKSVSNMLEATKTQTKAEATNAETQRTNLIVSIAIFVVAVAFSAYKFI